MKVYPLLIVCQATGALHTEVAHNYSTGAFLLAWDHFTSRRGYPGKVFSDKGSQLTSAGNMVAFGTEETWAEIEQESAKQGTEWEFAPAGAQFRNGLAEARVKAVKQTEYVLHHLENRHDTRPSDIRRQGACRLTSCLLGSWSRSRRANG